MNLFLPADVHKRDLHQVHFNAWKHGLKSLYYCRSLSIQRADGVSTLALKKDIMEDDDASEAPATGTPPAAGVSAPASASSDFEVCESCQ